MKNSLTEHERNCIRGLEMIRKAQGWALRNKVSSQARSIMREGIESNKGLQIRKSLLAAGFKELLNKIADELKPAPTEHYQSWWVFAFHGIAFPNKKWNCKTCGEPLTRLRLDFCSIKCQHAHQAKSVSASLKKLSRDQWKEIAARRQKTLKARHGVTSMMQIPEIAERSRQRLLQRPENEKAKTSRRRNRTLLRKYGTNAKAILEERAADGVRKAYRERGAEIYRKRSKTYRRRHGVSHHMQRPEIQSKVQRFRHKYVSIAGKTYRCQGYEPYVLRHLAVKGYKFSTEIRGIPYVKEGNRHMYFPDVRAVKGEKRLLIEVKSLFTFHWTVQHCSSKLLQATKYAEERGVAFYVIVVDPKTSSAQVLVNPRTPRELSLRKATTIPLLSE